MTLDGQHGTRATRAIPGSPAGFLAVELFQSEVHEEGIHVTVVGNASIQQPPPFVEIPAQRDLLLSAIGGEGEAGHVGGNGEPGMNGVDGAPATRESDATVSDMSGGSHANHSLIPELILDDILMHCSLVQMLDVGASKCSTSDCLLTQIDSFNHDMLTYCVSAGEGTDGGDGGDGGAIQIFVDQDNIHLLLAVHWDIQGGEGGPPGRHGEPGRGGIGGKGGLGHKW